MLNDPDMTGDLLLLGLAVVQFQWWQVAATKKERLASPGWVRQIEGWAGKREGWVKGVVADDVPRYEAPEIGLWKCVAPMLRRDTPCGSATGVSLRWAIRADGRMVPALACTRHREWQTTTVQAGLDAWTAAGEPKPEHNSGGALVRHFGSQWTQMYWRANQRVMEKAGHVMPDNLRAEIAAAKADELPDLRAAVPSLADRRATTAAKSEPPASALGCPICPTLHVGLAPACRCDCAKENER